MRFELKIRAENAFFHLYRSWYTMSTNPTFMKKSKVLILAGLVFAMPMLQQCMGSFALTNKVYDFNKTVGGKFVNEIVFFAFLVVPVYSATMFIDGVILNAIEFWTGSNPMAMNEGEVKKERFVTENGVVDVTITRNQIAFTNVDANETMVLNYAADETAWYMSMNGKSSKFVQFDMSGDAPQTIVFTPEGRSVAFGMGERNGDVVMNAFNAARFALK